MAHAVDLLVHAGILLDIEIALLDIRLRLVVVVVGDEELHGVVREKLLKLTAKLCRQSFVMRQDQCWALRLLDNIGHCERFARAGYAQ